MTATTSPAMVHREPAGIATECLIAQAVSDRAAIATVPNAASAGLGNRGSSLYSVGSGRSVDEGQVRAPARVRGGDWRERVRWPAFKVGCPTLAQPQMGRPAAASSTRARRWLMRPRFATWSMRSNTIRWIATSRGVPQAIAVTTPALIHRTHAQFKYRSQRHRPCLSVVSAQASTAGARRGEGTASRERRILPNSRRSAGSRSRSIDDRQLLNDESSPHRTNDASIRGPNMTKNSGFTPEPAARSSSSAGCRWFVGSWPCGLMIACRATRATRACPMRDQRG